MQEPVDMNVGFPYRVYGIKDFLGSLKLILDEFALNLLDFGDDLQNNAERCEHQQNDSQ